MKQIVLHLLAALSFSALRAVELSKSRQELCQHAQTVATQLFALADIVPWQKFQCHRLHSIRENGRAEVRGPRLRHPLKLVDSSRISHDKNITP